jgi:hypothetical protein
MRIDFLRVWIGEGILPSLSNRRVTATETMKRSLVVTLALALGGQAAGPLGAQDRPGEVRPLDPPAVPPPSLDSREVHAMSEALSRAIERGWESLHLLTRCPPSEELGSVEVFGSGVGIWDSSRQFVVPKDAIRRMLALLRDAGFAAMPAAPDGEGGSLEGPRLPRPGTEVTCQVSLELDGLEKTVVQLRKGGQSEDLRQLAGALLALSRGHAERGITPAGLADALARVASGELAPELLRLSVQRRPTPGQDGAGFVLAVRRQHAEARPFTPGGGFGEPRRVRLEAQEIRDLAGLLVRDRAPALPVNLWSDVYTDFEVSVMRWGRSIQARRFDGLKPDARGDQQKAFEHLLAGLLQLSHRVLKPGDGGG